jgi:hypothetical protein
MRFHRFKFARKRREVNVLDLPSAAGQYGYQGTDGFVIAKSPDAAKPILALQRTSGT